MGFLTRRELEERILDENGRLKPDTLLKDFVQYVGFRRKGKKEGLSFVAYEKS